MRKKPVLSFFVLEDFPNHHTTTEKTDVSRVNAGKE